MAEFKVFEVKNKRIYLFLVNTLELYLKVWFIPQRQFCLLKIYIPRNENSYDFQPLIFIHIIDKLWAA